MKSPLHASYYLYCLIALHVFYFAPANGQVIHIDTTVFTTHPRLLMLAGQEEQIKKNIAGNTYWGNAHNSIIEAADEILSKPPVEYKLIGIRLLDKSRECLRRVFYLSYAWRMTEKKKYFNRCEEEMLAVCKFKDWNPSHFLDVAEMTMGVAIGYDWLYNNLSPASRKLISDAIIEKGLNPSLEGKYNSWLSRTNNWNQVCNAGITFGAIAVYEQQPATSVVLIERALATIKLPMNNYSAEGNYAEGYSYWGYGTTCNVLFISALETLFKTDYGISNTPGFLKTASFYLNLMSNAGNVFNYSDSGGPEPLQPAMFWFARKLQQTALLYNEKKNLDRLNFGLKSNRYLPAALIWGSSLYLTQIAEPGLMYTGKGDNPLTVMRTSWKDPAAIYLGFKGGTPSASHAHMDEGSFVMDADGVRWSMDFGMQDYESLESKGIKLWDMGQNSQRWKVFRYNNFSHSTLTVNEDLQNAMGSAPIIKTSDNPSFMHAIMDLSEIYKNNLTKAKRGVALINKRYVIIQDEIETGDKACKIRWAMLTPANLLTAKANEAQLVIKDKTLQMRVANLEGIQFKTWRTDPPNSYDALNLGTSLIGFEIIVPPHTKKEFAVFLIPGSRQLNVIDNQLKPLSQW